MVKTQELISIENAGELIPASVFRAIRAHLLPAEDVFVMEIDPQAAASEDFCSQYGVSPEHGANCMVIKAARGSEYRLAACLSLVGRRLNTKETVRQALNARRISLAPLEDVIRMTGMEFGSITVIGLPPSWPILVEPDVLNVEKLFIGGGYRRSKICLPGKSLLKLPNIKVVEGLTMPLGN